MKCTNLADPRRAGLAKTVKEDRMSLNIDVNTKLVGLLGYPLGHSFSPVMQNRAFQRLGLNYLYLPIEVTADDLKDVVSGITKMNFAGYNITIPHKIRIMQYIDRVDELARIIGAVNVVSLNAGTATGYNTDGEGFVRSLGAGTGISVEGSSFFIVGSGGAARSIAMTLAVKEARAVFICNRSEQKAHELTKEVNTRVKPCSAVVPMESREMKIALRHTDVLVNTTSVGMHPNEDQMPIDADCLHENLIVADIVYNPVKTKLLKAAEEEGCRTLGGLGMLVYQGAEGFKIWTGMQPPIDTMFDAVRRRE